MPSKILFGSYNFLKGFCLFVFNVLVYPVRKISYFLECVLVFSYPLNIFTSSMCVNRNGILNLWSVLVGVAIMIFHIHLALFYVHTDINWFNTICVMFFWHFIQTNILYMESKTLTKSNHCRLVSKNLFPL